MGRAIGSLASGAATWSCNASPSKHSRSDSSTCGRRNAEAPHKRSRRHRGRGVSPNRQESKVSIAKAQIRVELHKAGARFVVLGGHAVAFTDTCATRISTLAELAGRSERWLAWSLLAGRAKCGFPEYVAPYLAEAL